MIGSPENGILHKVVTGLRENAKRILRRPTKGDVSPYEMSPQPLFQAEDRDYAIDLTPTEVKEVNIPGSPCWQELQGELSDLPANTFAQAHLTNGRKVICIRNDEGLWIDGWARDQAHRMIRGWFGVGESGEAAETAEQKKRTTESERRKFLTEQGWPIAVFHGTSKENFPPIIRSRVYLVQNGIFLSDHLAVASSYTEGESFFVLAIPASHLSNFNERRSFSGRKVGVRDDLPYVTKKEDGTLEIDLKAKINYKFSPELIEYLESINLSYELVKQNSEQTVVIPLLYCYPDQEKETGKRVVLPREWDEDLSSLRTVVLLRDGSEREIKDRPIKIPTMFADNRV